MITEPAKIFLPLTGLGVVAAMVYSVLTGDHAGITLFVALAAAALVAGVTVTVARENEVATIVAADAGPPERRPPPPVRLPGGPGWPALAALGTGLVVVAFIVGPLYAIAGAGLIAVGAVGWLASVAADRTGRVANLLPIGIPVVGLFAIFSLMFFMSRILLAVPEQASTFIALMVAVVIMGMASYFALKPQISSRTLMAALVVGSLVMVGGGLVAAVAGERHIEEHAHEPEEIELVSRNVAFNLKEITLHADQETKIKLDNPDTVPHNVAIYATEDFTGPALFQGAVIVGGEEITYEFKAPPAGTYWFRCDIHPTVMTGKVLVA